MRRVIAISTLAFALVGAGACSEPSRPAPSADTPAAATGAAERTAQLSPAATGSATAIPATGAGGAPHEESSDYTWDADDVVPIALDGRSATSRGDNVTLDGSTIIISAGGTYRLSGTLSDGQVVVDTDDDDLVRLILDGADITSSTTAAIAIMDASKAIVVLAANSQNQLTDAAAYVYPNSETDEPNATLFSAADLTITGEGSLTVKGNANDGISSKDGLLAAGGTLAVEAKDDGIRGKDYLVIRDGSLTVTAGGDALKADNEGDPALGTVTVAGGVLSLTATGDGIAAATTATVSGGTLTIKTGGGNTAKVAPDTSAKGIKGANTVISGGTLTFDTADDAVHADNGVTIAEANLSIATGDDAIHADKTLVVDSGTILIAKSYEGLESAAITINGGEIRLTSSDDGLNAAGGVDGSGQQRPGGGMGNDRFAGGRDNSVTITGGTIVVDADGDGIDANGSITMTGGTVIIQGPTANNNGAVDYDGTFALSGGTVIAVGSAGMAQQPSTTSRAASIMVRLVAPQPPGTMIHVRAADGTPLITFTASKSFQSVVFASPDLVKGAIYQVLTGGTSTGRNIDGLMTGGLYTAASGVAPITATAR